MNKPLMTASHDAHHHVAETMAGHRTVYPGATIDVTYQQGDEAGAVAALDRAYADVKQQITGMTTLVAGAGEED